jgi:Icc-related predicted phosphoesterase
MPKVTFISDTHNQHRKIKIPESDILIHAGDATGRGDIREVTSFLSWLSQQPAKHKIYIAGNHDFLFERDPTFSKVLLSEYPSITYLQDNLVEIMDLKIYGSPWTPRFYNWAFNADEDKLTQVWSAIPSRVDILVTHGPALDILDKTEDGDNVGCKILLQEIQTRILPKYHVAGHIHEGYGVKVVGETTFINASSCNIMYKPVNPPLTIDI